jgi:hypothetical protein
MPDNFMDGYKITKIPLVMHRLVGGQTTPIQNGVASHPLWGGSATLAFFLSFFFFFNF